MALLSARQVTKYFGGLCAVDNLDLTVNEGEIFALIGPNGSGKTTFTNLATGMMAPTSGHIEFQGTIVSGQRPHIITQMGLVRTFQNLRIFSSLTVLSTSPSDIFAAPPPGFGAMSYGPGRSRRRKKR